MPFECSETEHNRVVWKGELPSHREKWEVEAARLNAKIPLACWLITQHESEGYCGIGLNFDPEAYSTEEQAEARHKELTEGRKEHCGYFYNLEAIEIDVTND